MAEALLAENAVEVVQDLLARHRAGDAVTGRFLGGRVLPPARGRPVALELAPGSEEDPAAIFAAALRALAFGEATPDELLAIACALQAGRTALAPPKPGRNARHGDRPPPAPPPPPTPEEIAARAARRPDHPHARGDGGGGGRQPRWCGARCTAGA